MSKRFFAKRHVQVLIGVLAGGVLSVLYPHFAAQLKPLGDGFIRLIKMDQLFGIRGAATDAQAGARGRVETGGRPGDSVRPAPV